MKDQMGGERSWEKKIENKEWEDRADNIEKRTEDTESKVRELSGKIDKKHKELTSTTKIEGERNTKIIADLVKQVTRIIK